MNESKREMDQEVDSYSIANIHPDILQTHILARLDGPSLASIGATSSDLRALSADNTLWRDICYRTWPSTAHPLFRKLITSFPSGHRSFFCNAFSTLHNQNLPSKSHVSWSPSLMSAIDIKFKGSYILSRVQETYTKPGLWTGSPFQVNLLDHGDSLPIPGKLGFLDPDCKSELENNMTVSWILIDPTRIRAANLTTATPLCVERDWSNGDIHVRFGTVLSGLKKGDIVLCSVVVTCGGWENEDLHLKQVMLEFEDVDGNKLGWKDSLVILLEAVESVERTRRGEKGGYEEFSEIKRQRQERKMRRETVGIWTALVVVLGFLLFTMFPLFQYLYSHLLFPIR